jgi:hypothetical protein
MPALVAGIHVFLTTSQPEDMDSRDKRVPLNKSTNPGSDGVARQCAKQLSRGLLVRRRHLVIGEVAPRPAGTNPCPMGTTSIIS